MLEEEIEEIGAIQSLNRFAESLPPQFREQLYETARCFISIGAMHGVFAQAGTSGDHQEEYVAYLEKKAAENKQ